jgi:hypothetical protein
MMRLVSIWCKKQENRKKNFNSFPNLLKACYLIGVNQITQPIA